MTPGLSIRSPLTPAASAVLTYLDDLRGWSTALGQTLDSLDAASQVARDPAVFIREITLAMTRPSASAPARPITTPTSVGFMPSTTIRRRTSPIRAPSAMRIPISRTRRRTI